MLVLLPASATRPLYPKILINSLSGRSVSSLPSAPHRAASRGLDADGLAVAEGREWSRFVVAAAATAAAAASAACVVSLALTPSRAKSHSTVGVALFGP